MEELTGYFSKTVFHASDGYTVALFYCEQESEIITVTGYLPEINDAIRIPLKEEGKSLTVEVAQHLGDDTVRCIAMGPTDGLVRGMEAIATGGPISVPVGEKTLGRIFNVLGQPIDE